MRGGRSNWRLAASTAVATLACAGLASAQDCPSNCVQEHGPGGCDVPACSEAVCAIESACCAVEWDAFCVALAYENCGFYEYSCPTGPYPVNNCPTGAIVVGDGDVIAFNSTTATTVGPDEPECNSSKGDVPIWRDLWYRYDAPKNLPLGTLLTASNCNQTNFDSKIAAYDIGDGNFVPCELPQLFIACNEDGAGCADFTSELQIVVTAGTSYLIRMGGYLDAAGAGTISFELGSPTPPLPPTIFYTGAQQPVVQVSTGNLIYGGLSSGYITGSLAQRWAAMPFTVPVPEAGAAGGGTNWEVQTIAGNGFCPGGTCAPLLNYIIWSRTGQAKPVDGNQVVTGSVPTPSPDNDPNGEFAGNDRFRIVTNFELAPGDYYMTLYADAGAPNVVANWAWFANAQQGIPLEDAQGPFLWRSELFPAPGFLRSVITAWAQQPKLPANTIYTCAFGVYGVVPSTGIPGDLNEDGLVNGTDLTILLGSWGDCPSSGACIADLNDDGVVNGTDLTILLGNWTG